MTMPPEADRMPCGDQQRFALLCQAAFDGILVHDGGTIIEASERCAAMFGTTPEELLGRNVREITAPEWHAVLEKHITHSLSTPFESVARRLDGTRFPVEVCGVTIPGTAQRVVALRDLTARRMAEAAAAENADRYRDLVENSHELIGTHDLSGRILSANPALANAVGIPLEQIIGRNMTEFLVEPEGFAGYLAALDRHGIAQGVLAVHAADGSPRVWEYRNTLRREGVEAPVVRGTARDITEQREATHALRRSEELFRSIIESASDFISIIEPSGEIRYPSPSVEALLGHAPAAVTGRPFADLVHPEDAAAAILFLQTQRMQPRASETIALRLRHSNGTWRHFEVAAKNVLNHRINGADETKATVSAIVATARDITERKLLEKQLEQTHRLTSLGRLAATVAHEFNNVLMGMAPFAELMQRPSMAPELVARGARHIASSVARGKRIVQDLLRFTQPAEPELKPLHFADWWSALASETRAMLPNQIAIVTDLPAGGPPLVADASQLTQVFANLVANARDAMPEGGTLTLRAEQPKAGETYGYGLVPRPETFTHISVADTGRGISPEFLNHVFDPLFTTKTSGGTGLGLAVAHQVITRAGGHIFVESQPGQGAVFHIFLRNAAGTSAEGAARPAPPSLVAAKRLLIVEDEPMILEGVMELFTQAGMTVEGVTSGEEAVEAVERFEPEIVVLDITLPGIDGIETYHRIRQARPRLPVVFATGHGDGSRISGMLADNRTRFLQKPFEFSALLDMIGELELRSS
jgi:PAS domain S-box-containing protein